MEPSRGKRHRKRKRAEFKTAAEQEPTPISRVEPPPKPEILDGLTVGYNSTQRALEAQVRLAKRDANDHKEASESRPTQSVVDHPRRLAAVFVDRSAQPKIMYSHLPLLVSASASPSSEDAAVWLVPLPNGSEEKLSTALNIPRTAILGIYENATGARPLLNLVREKVPVVDPSWLETAPVGQYLPLKIDVHTAHVPVQPSKSIRRQQSRVANDSNT